jgi:fibro-slime domain-containing protein
VGICKWDAANPMPNGTLTSYFRELFVKNMVDTMLDSEGKPQLGSVVNFNRYIHKWFRPWKSGDHSLPIYQIDYSAKWNSATGLWEETNPSLSFTGIDVCNNPGDPRYNAYNNAFKNIVIQDSLPFIPLDSTKKIWSFYVLKMAGYGSSWSKFAVDTNFFPLDNRGFGNEPYSVTNPVSQPNRPKDHNFGFTMEMKISFIYHASENFYYIFTGDDDVWVFLNKKLLVDMGGIHSRQWPPDTTYLNNASVVSSYDLEEGKLCTMDLFLAERHSGGSQFYLTTNLVKKALRRR